MSYTFLLEQGEEFSAECFSDIPASVLWKLNLTAGAYSISDSETEFYRISRSGMTSKHSTEGRGEDLSMSSSEDSHAKISALLEKGEELTEKTAGSGKKCSEWFAKYDPSSSLWKIRQLLLFGDSDESLGTWPRWGLMRNGECFQQPKSDYCTSDKDYSFLPTPRKSDARGGGVVGRGHRMNLRDWWAEAGLGTSQTSRNPRFWEWIMAWPIEWTALRPLAMAKFQQWLSSHGKRFSESSSETATNRNAVDHPTP